MIFIFRKKNFNIMIIDKNNKLHIIADEGKVIRRIYDQIIFGNEVYLGIGKDGKEDKVEDFEEIDKPKEEEMKG